MRTTFQFCLDHRGCGRRLDSGARTTSREMQLWPARTCTRTAVQSWMVDGHQEVEASALVLVYDVSTEIKYWYIGEGRMSLGNTWILRKLLVNHVYSRCSIDL